MLDVKGFNVDLSVDDRRWVRPERCIPNQEVGMVMWEGREKVCVRVTIWLLGESGGTLRLDAASRTYNVMPTRGVVKGSRRGNG